MTEVFWNARQPVRDGVHPDLLTEKTDLWFPFIFSYDFYLASWFVSSSTIHSKINRFFNSKLVRESKTSFASAYTLHKLL